MQGCYQSWFSILRTWSQPSYPIHSPDVDATATEWVTLDETPANRISLQHILISGGQVSNIGARNGSFNLGLFLITKAATSGSGATWWFKTFSGQWLQKFIKSTAAHSTNASRVGLII